MRIMACCDESEETQGVLREALKHAKAFNADVLLVTSVLSAQKFYPNFMEDYQARLKEAQDYLTEHGVVCNTLISFHDVDQNVGEDLVSVAYKEGIDEIIIGIRRRSKLSKLIMGSVAQFVMLQADCSVLGAKK